MMDSRKSSDDFGGTKAIGSIEVLVPKSFVGCFDNLVGVP